MEADKLLYDRFLMGDTTAFEELVLKHKDNLIYFLQRYVKDVYTCEDIAQDCFAYLFIYKERYNKKYNFKTYLYAIAKNKAVDDIRKKNRQVVLSDTGIEAASANDRDELFEKVVKDEKAMLLHKAILMLKADYQTAIHLIDFEEMTYKEAAEVMGKTMPQLKVLVFRARKALKVLLEKEGYADEK